MRKFLALFLALLMVLTLVACGAREGAPAVEEEFKSDMQKEEVAENVKEEAKEESSDEEGRSLKVAMLTATLSNETWQAMTNGMIAVGMEKFGMDVTVMDCANNATKQNEQFESCINAGYDAIAIAPADPQALIATTEVAREAGIPVIAIGLPWEGCHSHVAGADYDAGYAVGSYMAEWANENWEKDSVNVVILTNEYEEACIIRADGLLTGFEENLNSITCNLINKLSVTDALDCQDQAAAVCQNNNVDILLALGGDAPYGFLLAYEEAGRNPDDIALGLCDLAEPLVPYTENGTVKVFGDWGSVDVDKPSVWLRAVQAALDGDINRNDYHIEYYDFNLITPDKFDEVLASYGWK